MIGDHVSSVLRQLAFPLRVGLDRNLYTCAYEESFDHYDALNNVIIGITINYSNDSEYWEGACVDWLVQGVHEAILAALKDDDINQDIVKDPIKGLEDNIKIEILRVAKYVVGVPRLFVILLIRQFEEKRETKKHKTSDILPIPKIPEVSKVTIQFPKINIAP